MKRTSSNKRQTASVQPRSGRATTPGDTPFTLIDTADGLQRTVEALRRCSVLAVDTESNSLYAYTERVCLIQVSAPAADYLIDPLAIDDMSPFGELLADPQIEKVFHAAEYDLLGLHRDLDSQVAPLFDTMWAARIVGWPQCGLAALLKTHFGVTQDKRMQRHNWGKRPLSPRALSYAVQDTHYLLPLRDILAVELKRLGRLEEAKEVFAEIHHVIERARTVEDYDFWRVKGARLLDATERSVLRELFQFREEEARWHDRPRFRIISDKVLVLLARSQPTSEQQLFELDVPRAVIRRYDQELVEAICRGKANPVDTPPPARNDYYSSADDALYEALRVWRKQVARRRRVDPDVILSNATLRDIAAHRPHSIGELKGVDTLGPWKMQQYGPALIRVILHEEG